MTKAFKNALGLACLLAVLFGSPERAPAGTIDWSVQTWTPGSLTHPSFNTGDNVVTFQFFDTNGAMAAAANSPSIVDGPLSGINQDQLYWAMDATARGQTSKLVITFQNPVTNLTFSLTDIDTGGNLNNGTYPSWQDRVVISAQNSSGQSLNVTGAAQTNPDAFTIDNNYELPTDTANNLSTQVTADVNAVGPDEARGNVTLTFANGVTTVVIDYFSGQLGPTNPSLQLIRITNLTFVPEPSTWAMLLLGLGGAAYAVRRKKQRRLAT